MLYTTEKLRLACILLQECCNFFVHTFFSQSLAKERLWFLLNSKNRRNHFSNNVFETAVLRVLQPSSDAALRAGSWGLSRPHFIVITILYNNVFGGGAWEKSSYNVASSFSVALGDFCLLVYDK